MGPLIDLEPGEWRREHERDDALSPIRVLLDRAWRFILATGILLNPGHFPMNYHGERPLPPPVSCRTACPIGAARPYAILTFGYHCPP
jgi:hypothetical protein